MYNITHEFPLGSETGFAEFELRPPPYLCSRQWTSRLALHRYTLYWAGEWDQAVPRRAEALARWVAASAHSRWSLLTLAPHDHSESALLRAKYQRRLQVAIRSGHPYASGPDAHVFVRPLQDDPRRWIDGMQTASDQLTDSVRIGVRAHKIDPKPLALKFAMEISGARRWSQPAFSAPLLSHLANLGDVWYFTQTVMNMRPALVTVSRSPIGWSRLLAGEAREVDHGLLA